MTGKVAVHLTMGLIAVVSWAGAPSDFDEYVAEIRQSGMSESAGGSVGMVAGILSGGTTFKATRGPDGSVGHSFSSNMCFVPTADPKLREKQRALQAAMAAKRDSWATFLKAQSDTDHSSFVSTKEGAALRRRVETALVATQLGISSMEELAKAVALDRSELQADLTGYRAMRAEAVKQGLEGMPELLSSLDRAP
jgi:hypothetical protein